MRLLVLGGTGYIGPHHVNAALERGHEVAIFTRGKADMTFGREVEHLRGDRSRDLAPIAGRQWDAVLDLATFGPIWVKTLGSALKGSVEHYTYISSQDVYAFPDTYETGTDEHKPVREFTDASDPYSLAHVELYRDRDYDVALGKKTFINIERAKQRYGSLKVLCEREAQTQFPQRALIIRPGFIVGPGDPNPAFTYWVERMSRGGDMLAAGDARYPVQIIDVTDFAQWVIKMVEAGETGIYNVAGPRNPLSLGEMLARIQRSVAAAGEVHWISVPWLLGQDLWPMGALFWATEPGGFCNPGRLNFDRALRKGLTFRPFEETVMRVLAWRRSVPPSQQGTVGAIERNGRSGCYEPRRISWPDYLAQERALLARWRAREL